MTETNPLRSFIRTPQIYVKLPSNGRFNKDGIDFTVNMEVPVRATTARDDLILRNPDALLNGDATEQLLKSCVPEIHNIRETPNNDIDVLLLAIQYATKGDKFEFTATCPVCGHENTYERSIRSMLESITEIPEVNSVTYNEGDNEITVIVRPYSYENNTKASLVELDSQKRMKYVRAMVTNKLKNENEDEILPLEKSDEIETLIKEQVSEAYKSLADLAITLMISSIIQINVKNPAGATEIVTKKEFIEEYVRNLTTEKQQLIKNKLDEVMSYGLDKKPKMICSGIIKTEEIDPDTRTISIKETPCGHEWVKEEVGYDQSNFFVPSLLQHQEKKS